MIPLGVLAGSRYTAPTYRTEVLADSPLAYLRLDESSGPPVDYGSLGVTPTAQNSWPTWGGVGIGDGDSSAAFSVSAGVGIGIGDISQIDTGPATFEALIRVDSLATTGVILAYSRYDGTSARVQVSGTGALVYVGEYWPSFVESSPGVISTATTYHVAVTVAGTNCTLYVNGSTVGSGIARVTRKNTYVWSVGRTSAAGYELPFSGNLAGVAVYNAELPAARILAHAQAAGVA